MAKLTVYLPDELAERLAPFRSVLNLSEIAKTAIEERLRMEQAAALGDLRGQVLNRLRRGDLEKTAMRARGFDAGRHWARTAASWKDMATVAGWPEITSQFEVVPAAAGLTTSLLDIAAMGVLKSYAPKRLYVPASFRAAPPPGTKPEMVILFWSGVAEGVRSIYSLVKDDMASEG